MKEQEQQILKLAEQFQADRTKFIKPLMKNNKGLTHEDATNVWMFKKLAEMQLQINNLRSQIDIHSPIG